MFSEYLQGEPFLARKNMADRQRPNYEIWRSPGDFAGLVTLSQSSRCCKRSTSTSVQVTTRHLEWPFAKQWLVNGPSWPIKVVLCRKFSGMEASWSLLV